MDWVHVHVHWDLELTNDALFVVVVAAAGQSGSQVALNVHKDREIHVLLLYYESPRWSLT